MTARSQRDATGRGGGGRWGEAPLPHTNNLHATDTPLMPAASKLASELTDLTVVRLAEPSLPDLQI